MMVYQLFTRMALFFYSTRNLVACGLALMGLGLYFTGRIEDWWLQITLGLYVLGLLLVPSPKGIDLDIRLPSDDPQELLAGLEDLIQHCQHRLPLDAAEILDQIAATMQELVPKMDDNVAAEQRIILTNAVSRDLPTTLNNFLKLPPAFASHYPMEGGKTCKALLVDQLKLLDRQLSKIAEAIYRHEAESLLANGHFLKDKFHSVSFVD